jgi:hypothetical protein
LVPSLLGANSNSPAATWPTTTATETTTAHIAIDWGTTTRSAGRALTPLLTRLDGYAHLLAIPHINTNTTLATLGGGERSNNRTARSVDRAKLQECTRFATNEIEIFDGSETSGQSIPQRSFRDIFLHALKNM